MSSGVKFPRQPLCAFALACLLAFLGTACTMAVRSVVHDQSGKPLRDAVVFATPTEPQRLPAAGKSRATMEVENFEFTPPVLPVLVGTGVSFLNRDNIEHQIYSISPAKNFRLSADRLASSAEVVFDRPGIVVVGSAIHDGMIGRIYVLETPYFATTGADGKADFDGLPRGAYEVRVWHPDMKTSTAATLQRVADSPGHEVGVDFTISVQSRQLPENTPAATVPKAREN